MFLFVLSAGMCYVCFTCCCIRCLLECIYNVCISPFLCILYVCGCLCMLCCVCLFCVVCVVVRGVFLCFGLFSVLVFVVVCVLCLRLFSLLLVCLF